MAVIFFKLRGVPEDEAKEVRELLNSNHIKYYETPEGRWKISMPAIWLPDNSQLQTAQELLDRYQQDRRTNAQDEYHRLKESGGQRTIIDSIKENPIRFFVYLCVVAFVLYLSIIPFTEIGR